MIKTYTVIHVAPKDLAPLPYAVVIVDDPERGRVAARADGDLSWLRVGARVALVADERFGLRCEHRDEGSPAGGELEPAA
jgi:uncharacterized OB-fold protein